MPLEDRAVGAGVRPEAVGRKARHGVAENRDVVLRLAQAFGALDAEPRKVLAHAGERALVQKARQVVRGVGQEFAPADADEQVEIFPRGRIRIELCGGLGEVDMGEPEGTGVALELGEPRQHFAGRSAAEKEGEQRVFVRPQEVDLVDLGDRCGGVGIEVRAEDAAGDPGQSLDREDAFGGDAPPARHGGLRNAEAAGQRTDSAGRPDRLLETDFSHNHPGTGTAYEAQPRPLFGVGS